MSRRHVQAAERHIRRVDEALNSLNADKLTELDRKARYKAVPDGFPARTMGDGMPSGSSPLTSVERAVDANVFGRPPSDDVGDAIRSVFDSLRQMSDLAAKIVRGLAYIDHVRLKAEGRQSSLAGECAACGEIVSGSESDRLKAGLCARHYEAMRRDAPDDRTAWITAYRATITEMTA